MKYKAQYRENTETESFATKFQEHKMAGGLGDLSLLSNMLQESQELEEQREEQNKVATMGPGDIGPKKPAEPVKPAKKVDPNAIWDEDEVDEGRILNKVDKGDKRARPKYDLRYRQNIKTDDALGAPWSVQDNSSMSCREIIIKVDMPGTKFSTVKLDVTRKEFLVQAPKYLLALSLSEDVNADKGSAKWDSDKDQLEVILPIVRGDDFAHYSMLDDPKRGDAMAIAQSEEEEGAWEAGGRGADSDVNG